MARMTLICCSHQERGIKPCCNMQDAGAEAHHLICNNHAGGCDKTAKMWNLTTNQSTVVARHDAPIRHVFSVKDMSGMLVTGGWDKSIRYWDLRQPNPVHVQQLAERVYAMDVRYPLAVVGLANRRIQVRSSLLNIRNHLLHAWCAEALLRLHDHGLVPPACWIQTSRKGACMHGTCSVAMVPVGERHQVARPQPQACTGWTVASEAVMAPCPGVQPGHQPNCAVQGARVAAQVPDALRDGLPRRDRLPGEPQQRAHHRAGSVPECNIL